MQKLFIVCDICEEELEIKGFDQNGVGEGWEKVGLTTKLIDVCPECKEKWEKHIEKKQTTLKKMDEEFIKQLKIK